MEIAPLLFEIAPVFCPQKLAAFWKNMFIENIFENFDPFDGKIPLDFRTHFYYIATKARQYLKKRSKKEIKNGLATIPKLYAETDSVLVDIIATGKPYVIWTPAFALKVGHGIIDLEKYGDFPNPRWTDYFSILALALTGSAHFPDQISRHPDIGNILGECSPGFPAGEVGELAITAMECITLAEMFDFAEQADKQALIDYSNRKRSELARKAATSRHAPLNLVKEKFIRYMAENEDRYQSRNQAAMVFLKKLPPTERALLSKIDDNAIRTLTEAERKHRKESPV